MQRWPGVSDWNSYDPPSLRASVSGGLVAAAAAGATMAFLRWTLQVRTVPERTMEWALLFVPVDLFEAALERFGFEAKRNGLLSAIALMVVVLATLGAVALYKRWATRSILVLGLGLWLFTMVVIMPLTSAGFFATALLDGTKAAILGHLAVALVYAGTLALLRASESERAYEPATSIAGSRRSAMVLMGGAIAALAATYAAEWWGPRSRLATVMVRDPQEPFPSGGIDPPQPHPTAVAGPSSSPGVQPTAAGGADLFPEPAPARPLKRDNDGAVLPSGRRKGELAEPITGNDDFYIVTKNAAGDPVLRAEDWRLRVDGQVQRPIELDYVNLRRLPAVEVTKTLECISNFVCKCDMAPYGCDLISTARWKGVRLSDVLALAGGLKPGVVSLAAIAADEFTTALPIEAALDPETLLVYEMNGQVLPREHGYPVRVLVPGHYGMKNAKWVVGLRPMGREFVDWYGQRQWNKQAIVKTMTRIDLPGPGAELPPGEHRIAGIAYAGDRGVAKVEFSADGGRSWRVAELLEPPSGGDTWVRWQGDFTLAPGSEATLVARATDGSGALQPDGFSLPQPDGGTGWNTVDVRAGRA